MGQELINWVFAAAGAAFGWVMKIIWEAITSMRADIKSNQERLQTDLRDIDQKMHDDFVRRDDFKDAITDIRGDMHRGFNKVDDTLGLLFKKLDK
jgi:hypothetical protein